jgi:hypothetical protein
MSLQDIKAVLYERRILLIPFATNPFPLPQRCLGDKRFDFVGPVKRRLALCEADKLLQVDAINELPQWCRYPKIRRQVESRVGNRGRGVLAPVKKPYTLGMGVDEMSIDILTAFNLPRSQLFADLPTERGRRFGTSLVDDRHIV